MRTPALAPWKGGLSGTVLKRLKRGGRVTRTARVDGTFDVEDWDPYWPGGAQDNCTSPASSYSATPMQDMEVAKGAALRPVEALEGARLLRVSVV